MKIAIVLLALAGPACAQDSWGGADKREHFIIGSIIGAVGTGVSGSMWTGFAIGAGAGVLKESLDTQKTGGKFSGKDVAATMLGAAVGVAVGGLVIRYSQGTTQVAYTTRF